MQEDFLNSEKWLSLVFEGRNKEFGAYVHREESSNRHLEAMFIITVVVLGMIFLPKVIKSPLSEPAVIGQNGDVKIAVVDQGQKPEQNQVKPIEVPPLKLKPTIGFTTPLITKDDKVRNEDLMQTQQALTESKADISVVTVEGDPKGTVDIVDVKPIVGETTSKPEIPVHVEVMPMYPGGEAALMKWLQENMTYPADAQERNIQGRVSLRFVVTADGSIDNVQIIKGLDPSCDREALRVMKKMPKWIPGKQNGKAVSVYYSLPVVFKLNNQ